MHAALCLCRPETIPADPVASAGGSLNTASSSEAKHLHLSARPSLRKYCGCRRPMPPQPPSACPRLGPGFRREGRVAPPCARTRPGSGLAALPWGLGASTLAGWAPSVTNAAAPRTSRAGAGRARLHGPAYLESWARSTCRSEPKARPSATPAQGAVAATGHCPRVPPSAPPLRLRAALPNAPVGLRLRAPRTHCPSAATSRAPGSREVGPRQGQRPLRLAEPGIPTDGRAALTPCWGLLPSAPPQGFSAPQLGVRGGSTDPTVHMSAKSSPW